MRLAFLSAPIVALALAAPLAAPADAAGVGLVLLHARNSFPTQFDGVIPRLEAAGYPTIAINACWSVRRTYAGTAAECQVDIDDAIAGLKGRGMDRFVIAGNDFGGMYALYYAGNHPEIAGVVAWGPRTFIRGSNDETLGLALRVEKRGGGRQEGVVGRGAAPPPQTRSSPSRGRTAPSPTSRGSSGRSPSRCCGWRPTTTSARATRRRASR
jgi:pimeloyl-ACP methyl ester carboxylesterase